MAEQAIAVRKNILKWLRPFIYLGAAATLLGSLMPHAPFSVLITDLPSHFVVYYLLGSFVLAVCAAAFRLHRLVWLPLVAVMALNIAALMPYLPAGKIPTAAAEIKILQANLLYLNGNAALLHQLIAAENPDIIALSEVNADMAQSLEKIKNAYPYHLIEPMQNDARGLALLSRIRAASMTRVTFGDSAVPAHLARLETSQGPLTIVSIHPRTPLHGLALRDADFTALAEKFRDRADMPLVITGDFNATPWCPALKGLKRSLALRDTREGYGLNGTWPVWLPAPLRLPIDHTLVSGHVQATGHRLGPGIGSDHLPSLISITLRPANR